MIAFVALLIAATTTEAASDRTVLIDPHDGRPVTPTGVKTYYQLRDFIPISTTPEPAVDPYDEHVVDPHDGRAVFPSGVKDDRPVYKLRDFIPIPDQVVDQYDEQIEDPYDGREVFPSGVKDGRPDYKLRDFIPIESADSSSDRSYESESLSLRRSSRLPGRRLSTEDNIIENPTINEIVENHFSNEIVKDEDRSRDESAEDEISEIPMTTEIVEDQSATEIVKEENRSLDEDTPETKQQSSKTIKGWKKKISNFMKPKSHSKKSDIAEDRIPRQPEKRGNRLRKLFPNCLKSASHSGETAIEIDEVGNESVPDQRNESVPEQRPNKGWIKSAKSLLKPTEKIASNEPRLQRSPNVRRISDDKSVTSSQKKSKTKSALGKITKLFKKPLSNALHPQPDAVDESDEVDLQAMPDQVPRGPRLSARLDDGELLQADCEMLVGRRYRPKLPLIAEGSMEGIDLDSIDDASSGDLLMFPPDEQLHRYSRSRNLITA